ncbi:MAG: hypothetical protein ABIJ21_08955 [Nanoarchaeota archaeon]
MTNATREVWDILANDISIRKDISRGIVNNRALAKYIIKNYRLNVSLDGVISAIRRFERDQKIIEDFKTVKEVLKGAKISTRTNMASIMVSENSQNAKYLAEFITDPYFMNNEAVRLTKGEEHMKIMISQTDLPRFKKIFTDDLIQHMESDLAELNITLTQKACETKGVHARITNEIANHDINIKEAITVLPEIIIFIKNVDLIKTHEAVFSLISAPALP